MIPAELKAAVGDKILPKFKKLVAYIDSQKLLGVDDRVQINETGNGTYVNLLSRNLIFQHPLKIRLTDNYLYQVHEGYVNSEVPFFRTDGKLGKILQPLDKPKANGVIPKNIFTKDTQWLFCYTFVTRKKNEPVVGYIECLNTELIDQQRIVIDQLFLGKSHVARPVDTYTDVQYEYYVPMAFMREDKIIHNFCWHNIIIRPYKIGITNRVIFYPA